MQERTGALNVALFFDFVHTLAKCPFLLQRKHSASFAGHFSPPSAAVLSTPTFTILHVYDLQSIKIWPKCQRTPKEMLYANAQVTSHNYIFWFNISLVHVII